MTIGITELPPEGMQLGGVALAGDSSRGTRTTEGLSLLFTTAGITVQGPQPQIERLLVWSGLDAATCSEKVVLPDGRNASVMELTSGGQSIRFLLPTDTVSPGQAAYLDQALPAWLARYRAAEEAALGLREPATSTAAGGRAVATTAPARPSEPPPPPAPAAAAAAAAAAAGAAASPGSAATGTFNGTVATPGTTSSPASAPNPPPPPRPAPSPAAGPPPPVPPPVPPPPPTPGTVTWVLSVDPMPPGSEWENPPIGDLLADEPLPPKRRWRRRKTKAAGSAAAVGAAGATIAAAGSSAPAATPPLVTAPPASTAAPPPPPPSSSPSADTTPPAGVEPDQPVTAGAAAPAPTATPPPPPPPTRSTGDQAGTPDTSTPAPDEGLDAEAAVPGTDAPRPRRNSRLVVLSVALLAVIGGIAYLVASRNSSSPSKSLAPVTPLPTTVAPDTTLVNTIILRVADLPPGWAQAAPSTPLLRLPVASPTAEAQATRTLSSCLNLPVAATTGLFAGGALPGQTATSTSPTFVQTADTGIQMHSTTTALGTASEAQSFAVPFENPDFIPCYGQFERTVAAAAVPGAIASVQAVTLPPPAGVKSFGFITTVTSSQGTQLYGQAFLIGGRLVTDVMPATNGPEIPSSDFASAYDAIGARMSASLQK